MKSARLRIGDLVLGFAPQLTSCVTMLQSLTLSEPWFLNLYKSR